ncbi:unnamed protein product [Trichobilharzia regenti]|nr:unnamed protein product [Trichobilharzia regenti]
MKSFLRELTEPLLTFELYDEILGTGGLGAREKVALAKELILMKLPDDNYEILNFLIRFLTEVSEFSFLFFLYCTCSFVCCSPVFRVKLSRSSSFKFSVAIVFFPTGLGLLV